MGNLILDGQRHEYTRIEVYAPEGGRVIWRFITPKKQVWRVCLDSRIPAARTMVNTDATEVRVVSLLWPIQELCEIVHAAKTDRQKRDVVRGFLANLLRQFDWRFVGTIHALTKVPNGRRDRIGAIPKACDMVQLEVPEGMVKEVCSKVTLLGANPTHAACATFLREFEKELEKTDLMEDFDVDWLSLIVKRLALKYDTLTPEPEHRAKHEGLRRVWEGRKITYPTQAGPCRREGCRRVWEGNAEITDEETVSDADCEKILLFPRRVTPIKPRFAPLHARDAESSLFGECKRHAVSDERMDAKNEDGYAFQNFLRSTEFVAVHNWPDFTLALPVRWVDTVLQDLKAGESAFVGEWASKVVTNYVDVHELTYKDIRYVFDGPTRWEIVRMLCGATDPEGWVKLPNGSRSLGAFSDHTALSKKKDIIGHAQLFRAAAIEPKGKRRGNRDLLYRLRPYE